MGPGMCLNVKLTVTNGGECNGWNPLWELHLKGSCECSEPWLKRKTNAKLGPQDTIKNILKRRCLKCPHIVHLDLICIVMIKKKGGNQNGNLTPDHKSLKSKGQLKSHWSVLYTVRNIFLKNIIYFLCIFKIDLIWERYECPKFWDNKSPNFGIATWEF
jgi:hypothetical protein